MAAFFAGCGGGGGVSDRLTGSSAAENAVSLSLKFTSPLRSDPAPLPDTTVGQMVVSAVNRKAGDFAYQFFKYGEKGVALNLTHGDDTYSIEITARLRDSATDTVEKIYKGSAEVFIYSIYNDVHFKNVPISERVNRVTLTLSLVGTSGAGTGTAAKGTALLFNVTPPSIITDGFVWQPFTVWVVDAAGNRVKTATDEITVSLSSGSFSKGIYRKNAINGAAVFDDLMTSGNGGPFRVTASAPGLSSVSTSYDVTVDFPFIAKVFVSTNSSLFAYDMAYVRRAGKLVTNAPSLDPKFYCDFASGVAAFKGERAKTNLFVLEKNRVFHLVSAANGTVRTFNAPTSLGESVLAFTPTLVSGGAYLVTPTRVCRYSIGAGGMAFVTSANNSTIGAPRNIAEYLTGKVIVATDSGAAPFDFSGATPVPGQLIGAITYAVDGLAAAGDGSLTALELTEGAFHRITDGAGGITVEQFPLPDVNPVTTGTRSHVCYSKAGGIYMSRSDDRDVYFFDYSNIASPGVKISVSPFPSGAVYPAGLGYSPSGDCVIVAASGGSGAIRIIDAQNNTCAAEVFLKNASGAAVSGISGLVVY